MLESTPIRSSASLLPTHIASSSSSSTAESRQNVLIRNAIASDSQRIRVQDESTGKSYELHLGKGAPYPKRFGGDDPEDYSFEQQAADTSDATHKEAPSAASSKGRATRPLHVNGNQQPSSNSAQSAPSSSYGHRVLRLPMIVRHRGGNVSSSAPNGNPPGLPIPASPSDAVDGTAATTTAANGRTAEPDAAAAPTKPVAPHRSWSGTARNHKVAQIAPTPGDVQLQELNKKYHESLAATSQANIVRQSSRDSSSRGVSRERTLSNGSGREGPASTRMSPQKPGSQHSVTRHYPIMSELPPSPPLEEDEDGRPAQLSDVPLRRPTSRQQRGNSPLTIDTGLRREYHRQASTASTTSAYMSAEEDASFVAGEEEEEEPTTPKARTPTMNILRSSPERMHSSPQQMQDGLISAVAEAATPLPALAPKSIPSGYSSESKSSRASTSLSPGNYLHPASAAPLGPASPSRRGKRSDGAIHQQPSRRNTTGSSAGSVDSVPRQLRNGDFDQGTGFDWQTPDGVGPSSSPAGQTIFPDTLAGISTSISVPGSRALRTGDAGFDEELAKAEASVRKRIERQRRDEEEKSLAAQEVEKSQALERAQLLRDRERERERERAAGSGALPALMRAKSNMTKLGGAGTSGGQANGPSGQLSKVGAGTEEEKAVVVGNIINETHVNYVMMYNMLTGIRIGVSRCQAKVKRPLRDEDYKARHKFTFDIIGNELTPSAKYDFKFKDYAPWVFRELREYFHLDPGDYLLSLTAKYILSELGSPGKSGSFFYFSRDYRFIIKTIRHSEHRFLLKILKDYHEHVKANPHTLLSRFYGLHRVKLPHGRKIHFVIMNNLFPPHRDIHETYDLKGSSYGREYPEDKARTKKGATLKDINWIRRRRELELGPEKRDLFAAQLASDVALLKKLNIMDYSLLIGLHDIRRGNSENLRQEKLQIVQPQEETVRGVPPGNQMSTLSSGPLATAPSAGQASLTAIANAGAAHQAVDRAPPPQRGHSHIHSAETPPDRLPRRESTATVPSDGEYVDAETGLSAGPTSTSPGAPTSLPSSNSKNATVTDSGLGQMPGKQNVFALRAAVRRCDPKALGSSSTAQLPAEETSERRHFLFYQDEGGFRSTGDDNEPGQWIYYLGIIDLFTPYSGIKRGENWWKRITMDGRTISAVPPTQYGTRFVKFLTAVTRPIKWGDLPPGFDKVKPLDSDESKKLSAAP